MQETGRDWGMKVSHQEAKLMEHQGALDGDVDQADFGRFQACLSGAGAIQSNPECLAALIDDDGDVDGDDTQLFLGCLSGPDIPVSPQCAE